MHSLFFEGTREKQFVACDPFEVWLGLAVTYEGSLILDSFETKKVFQLFYGFKWFHAFYGKNIHSHSTST
jgi:hypothetical protein